MGRVGGATPDADLPAEERGFALLHPRGSDRNEVERDLRVAGYTDPGAAAAFGMLRMAGAAVAGTMTALTLWLSGNWPGSSEARRVGQECVSTVRSRGSTAH